jgi:hypothetical protein
MFNLLGGTQHFFAYLQHLRRSGRKSVGSLPANRFVPRLTANAFAHWRAQRQRLAVIVLQQRWSAKAASLHAKQSVVRLQEIARTSAHRQWTNVEHTFLIEFAQL